MPGMKERGKLKTSHTHRRRNTLGRFYHAPTPNEWPTYGGRIRHTPRIVRVKLTPAEFRAKLTAALVDRGKLVLLPARRAPKVLDNIAD